MEYMMYDCKEVALNDGIVVDECIAEEVAELRRRGVNTVGCCCGHGVHLGFIQVSDDSIKAMEVLGYQHYLYHDACGDHNRNDAFIPMSNRHITTKTVPYKWKREGLIIKDKFMERLENMAVKAEAENNTDSLETLKRVIRALNLEETVN